MTPDHTPSGVEPSGPPGASGSSGSSGGQSPSGAGPDAQPYIGVAAASQPDAHIVSLARELGRQLAMAGAVIVCGGGYGAMAAVCAGARAAGGVTVGLLPGTDRAEGNADLSLALPTGLGEGRNFLLVRASDALVAVGAGFGTLSEIALALRTGIPVVGLATWSLAYGDRPVAAFPAFDDPARAAEAVLTAASDRLRRRAPRTP